MIVLLAILSYLTSYVVADAFPFATWQLYSTLILIDSLFLYVVSQLNINPLRKKLMALLFYLSICTTALTSCIIYIYDSYDFITESLSNNIVSIHTDLSIAISLIIIIISILPKGSLCAINKHWTTYTYSSNDCTCKSCLSNRVEGLE